MPGKICLSAWYPGLWRQTGKTGVRGTTSLFDRGNGSMTTLSFDPDGCLSVFRQGGNGVLR